MSARGATRFWGKTALATGAVGYYCYSVVFDTFSEHNNVTRLDRWKRHANKFYEFHVHQWNAVRDSMVSGYEDKVASVERSFSSDYDVDRILCPEVVEVLPLNDGAHHVSDFMEAHKDEWKVESSTLQTTLYELEVTTHYDMDGTKKLDDGYGQESFSNTDLATIQPSVRVLRQGSDYNGDVRVMRIVGMLPRVTPGEVAEYLVDVDKRKKWDRNYKSHAEIVRLPAVAPGHNASVNVSDALLKGYVDVSDDLLPTLKKGSFFGKSGKDAKVADVPDEEMAKKVTPRELREIDVATQGLGDQRASAPGTPSFIPKERSWLYHRVSNKVLESLGVQPRVFFYERAVAMAECQVVPGSNIDAVRESEAREDAQRQELQKKKLAGMDDFDARRIAKLPNMTRSLPSVDAFSIQYRTLPYAVSSEDPVAAQNDPLAAAAVTPKHPSYQLISSVLNRVMARFLDKKNDVPVFMHHQEVLLLPLNGRSKLDALAKINAMQIYGGCYANAEVDPVPAKPGSVEPYNHATPTFFFEPEHFADITDESGKVYSTSEYVQCAKAAKAKGKTPPKVWYRLRKASAPAPVDATQLSEEEELALSTKRNFRGSRQEYWTALPERRSYVAPHPAAQPLLDELSSIYKNNEDEVVKAISRLAKSSAFTKDGELFAHGTLMVMTSVNDVSIPKRMPTSVQKSVSQYFTSQAYTMLLHTIGADRMGSKERYFDAYVRKLSTIGMTEEERKQLNAEVERELERRKKLRELQRARGAD